MGFALGQRIYRIGREPAGVAELGVNRGVRGAKPTAKLPTKSIAALPIQR